MKTKQFKYYQEEEMLIGWLDEFPDYKTQGSTLDELKENLKDIYEELTSGRIPLKETSRAFFTTFEVSANA